MKIDAQKIRKRIIGFTVGILMNGTGIFATDPTTMGPKLDSVAPNTTQPDKVLLAGRGGGGGSHGGGFHSGGSRGGSYHGSGSRGYSGARSSSRMSSGRSSGSRSYTRSKGSTSRTSSMRRSGSTTRTRKTFSTTGKRSATSSQVASTRGTGSRSFATRTGGRGGGGGGRHHGGQGHHGHNHYWHNFGWGPGWGCWYGPWWGFWGFPGYWAWYWPGFALSVFYAGLYATDRIPYVVVLGEDSVNYYAVYNRAQDDDGNVVYIKTDRYGIVNPKEKTEIEITDRSNNLVIIARDEKKLGDTLRSDVVSSKDNYSVVDPTEAPDKLEEGEKPEVTDKHIQEFQKQVKDNKNAELLKEKAAAADTADTSEAEKEADKWEKESREWEQVQATEVAD